MSREQMIYAIKSVYDGPEWAGRLDNMSDRQVAAIYFRLMNANKLK